MTAKQTKEERKGKKKVASAKWYKSHSEKARAISAAWRKNNPEKARATVTTWRKVNPEKVRAIDKARRKAHPEKRAANDSNRRARTQNAEGRHTAEEVKRLLVRQKYRCAVCKKSIKAGYHKDHIIPLSRGGSNCIRNIQLLCPTCNCKKGSKHPIPFMRERGFLL
jgi:5-methylcytosine-specific restriction endonuclease McrA